MRAYLFLLVTFISCNDSIDNVSKKENSPSLKQNEYSETDFLNDPNVPNCFKEFYLKKLDPNSNDSCGQHLIDSIASHDKLRQPYYFLTLTRTFDKADGAYSESVCHFSMEYIKNNTNDFLHQFLTNKNLTDDDLELWANITKMELIDFAETDAKKEVENYINIFKGKFAALNDKQNEKLNKLIKLLESNHP